MFKKTIVILLAGVLGGCATEGPKQQSGTLIGAVAGGLIGSQFGDGNGRIAAGVLGAIAGGAIGNSIGARLDEQDRRRLREITSASFRSGRSGSFRNSRTGVRGKTTIVKSNRVSGNLCRTVKQEVTLPNGQVSSDTVSGCKGPNGWTV